MSRLENSHHVSKSMYCLNCTLCVGYRRRYLHLINSIRLFSTSDDVWAYVRMIEWLRYSNTKNQCHCHFKCIWLFIANVSDIILSAFFVTETKSTLILVVMSSCATFRNTIFLLLLLFLFRLRQLVRWECLLYFVLAMVLHNACGMNPSRVCECELISFVLDILSGTSNRNGQQTFKFN